MPKLLIFIAFLIFPTLAFANGEKKKKVVITFHLSSEKNLGPKMTFPWTTALGKKYFKQSSEFKTSMIKAQRPFPSPHAETEYGMIFQFDKEGRRRLQRLTSINIGKHLIVFMNGKPMDMLYIDREVKDGIVCIWRGLVSTDVHKADEFLPRIGETKKQWKARLKKEAKSK